MVVSKNSRYGIVGAYVPPNDTTTLIQIAAALDRFSRRRKVVLVGDLNLNLDSVESDWNMEIAKVLADVRLLNMHHHFKSNADIESYQLGIKNASGI